MAVIKTDGGYNSLPISYKRGNPIPLDKSSVWYDYNLMKAYAESDPVAYVGQILGLVDSTNGTATAYIILNVEGELQKIGASTEIPKVKGDNASIVLKDEAISLKNWGVKYYKYIHAIGVEGDDDYQPAQYIEQIVDEEHPWIAGLEPKVVIDEGGNQPVLGWYEPNPTTVEGLGSQMASLQTTVNALQGFAQNVYSKTETEQKIDEKVAAAAHLKRKIVNSIDEIDRNAKDADLYIYMVPNLEAINNDNYDEYMVIIVTDDEGIETRFVEKVGSWSVSMDGYVTDNELSEALKNKIDVQEGFTLIPIEDLNKLSGIEAGAQKNFISAVDENSFVVEAGKLILNKIAVSQVADLQNLLNAKVDAEPGKGLSTNDLTDELLQIITSNDETVSILQTKVSSLEVLLDIVANEDGTIVSTTINDIRKDIGSLNDILKSHSDTIKLHTTAISDLNTLVNGHTESITTMNTTITGIQNTINGLADIYVTKAVFENTVGSLEELQASASTLHTQVKELQEALTWGELTN